MLKKMKKREIIFETDSDFPEGLKAALQIEKSEVVGKKRKREGKPCKEKNHEFQVVGKFIICRICCAKQPLEETEPTGNQHKHDFQCIETGDRQFAVCTKGCGCIMKLL